MYNSPQFKIGKRFTLDKKVGMGGFGEVYLAKDSKTGLNCAVKMESRTGGMPILNYEYKILEHLKNIEGVPNVHKFGL
jgi:serine/threonine protein kinase